VFAVRRALFAWAAVVAAATWLTAGCRGEAAAPKGPTPGNPDAAVVPPDARLAVDASAAAERPPPDVAAADRAPVDASAGPAAPDGPLPVGAGPRIFDLEVLHEIAITVEAAYLPKLEQDREHRVPCTLSFDGVTLTQVGIRQKGGYGSSSTLQGKPGFSIKFNEFVPGQKLAGMKKLLLNNAKEDATFLSEHIGYQAHRSMGLPAALTSHGIVTFNGRVYGVFVVKEAESGDLFARNFGPGNADGNAYEGVYHRPPDQLLGDFVLHPELPELKDEVAEMRSRDDIKALAAAILDTPDAQFAQAVGKLFNLDGYLTALAVDTFVGFWDSYAYYLNNYFLYHNPADGRFVYLPHGMDQLRYSPPSPVMGKLVQRVRAIPALDAQLTRERDRVKQQWDVAAMQARIDRVAKLLHGTGHKEPAVVADIKSFDANVQAVRASVAALKR
jgi:hypothetical protein